MSKLQEATPDYVVIWSGEHFAYWKAGSCGYAADIRDAGLYLRSEGENITQSVGPEKKLSLRPATRKVVTVTALS